MVFLVASEFFVICWHNQFVRFLQCKHNKLQYGKGCGWEGMEIKSKVTDLQETTKSGARKYPESVACKTIKKSSHYAASVLVLENRSFFLFELLHLIPSSAPELPMQ